MKVNGNLERAALEAFSSNPGFSITGLMWLNTTVSKMYLDDGSAVDALVQEAKVATLTGKILSGNTASGFINGAAAINFNSSGTITVPSATDTLVARTTADILTNKDIDGGTASNSLRLTLPKNTKANLDALTRKLGTIVYATDLEKTYVDNGSLLVEVGAAALADGSVTTPKLANNAVTIEKMSAKTMSSSTASAGNIAISASSGSFSTTSGSNVAVTNLSVTITTTGRPVRIELIGVEGAAGGTSIGVTGLGSSSLTATAIISLFKEGVLLTEFLIDHKIATGTASFYTFMPVSTIDHMDPVVTGTYTYDIRARVNSTGNTAFVLHAKLIAYEI